MQGNKLLYTADRVHALFAALRDAMRNDLYTMHSRHVREMDELRRELDQVRNELRAAVIARTQARAEVAALYREREIARARAAKRDMGQSLQ